MSQYIIKEYYGKKFRLLGDGEDLASLLMVEFDCFSIGLSEEEGGLGKYGHFMRIVELLWNNPDLQCKKRYIHNPWAERFFRAACEERYLGVAGCASAGKCVHPNTTILYHDGSIRQAKDVKVGDSLMGDDGGPRIVQEIHHGSGPMYRVIPRQGDVLECSGDHVMVLKRTHTPKKSWRRLGEVREISVADYYHNATVQFRQQNRIFCRGIDLPEQDVFLDPRIYGLWLGDGATNDPSISIADFEVEELDYVSRWAVQNGFDLRTQRYGSSCPAYRIVPKGANVTQTCPAGSNPLIPFFQGSLVDGTKRIRKEYLSNSRKIRMELLAGLLDSDGHAAGTYFEYSTKSPGLKDDIVYLARSLGFRVTATHCHKKCQTGIFSAWRINIIGDTTIIPTLRKKCTERERGMSDCMPFKVEKIEDGEWVGFSVDGNHRHLLGDFTVTHNSDPAALWAIVNYLADPSHTKVLVMSTTIAGAKLRIWKTLTEYWTGLSQIGQTPGKALWSNNLIKGPSYDFQGLSDAAGIQLLASEKSKEKESLEKVIGIKAPKTDGPRGRQGKLIMLIDEMTGCSESVLHAAYNNLDSNENFQLIGLGNPNSLFDTFGLFCEPEEGWDILTEEDMEWKTKRGLCIRFDAQYNPRITENDDRLVWMPTQAKIDQAIREYGPKSLFFNRMFRAVFTKEGEGNTIYSAADFLSSRAFDKVIWSHEKPINVAFLDPSFTEGGDRCIVTFGRFGTDLNGKPVLEFGESVPIHINVSDKETPHNYQVARKFRDLCLERQVAPENAGFDSTGAGGPFGDILSQEWSPLVKRVNFAGSPSGKTVSTTNRTPAKDFYANRVTEIWYAAKPLMASGQLKGFRTDVAKEICVRENYKGPKGENTRKLQVETKREMKSRTGESPDLGDSAFGLVEVCRNNFSFRKTTAYIPPISIITDPDEPLPPPRPQSSWRNFAAKNRLTIKRLSR